MTKKQKEVIEMTKQRLQEQIGNPDIEVAHAEADEVLLDLLTALKLTEIVELYNKIDKWYA